MTLTLQYLQHSAWSMLLCSSEKHCKGHSARSRYAPASRGEQWKWPSPSQHSASLCVPTPPPLCSPPLQASALVQLGERSLATDGLCSLAAGGCTNVAAWHARIEFLTFLWGAKTSMTSEVQTYIEVVHLLPLAPANHIVARRLDLPVVFRIWSFIRNAGMAWHRCTNRCNFSSLVGLVSGTHS